MKQANSSLQDLSLPQEFPSLPQRTGPNGPQPTPSLPSPSGFAARPRPRGLIRRAALSLTLAISTLPILGLSVGTAATVTFNANGGSGTMAAQTSAAATTLRANSFTRGSFVFYGWNTAADASGTALADAALFNFTADTTLYAQWAISVNSPWFAVVSPDGSRAYVTDLSALAIATVNTATGATLGELPYNPQRPIGMGLSPDGSRLYVQLRDLQTGAGVFGRIDTTTNPPQALPSLIRDPGVFLGMGLSADGTRFYGAKAGGMRCWTTDGTPLGEISLPGGFYRRCVLPPSGRLVYVIDGYFRKGVAVLDVSNDNPTLVTTLMQGALTFDMDLSPDGTKLFVGDWDEDSVSVFDCRGATPTLVTKVSVGDQPATVRCSPDGRFAYVCSYASHTISVIDAEETTPTVVRTLSFPPGEFLRNLALSPDCSLLYVVHDSTNRVGVVKVREPRMFVRFLPNGGRGGLPTKYGDRNVAADLSYNTYTRFGCRFSGWNTAADGSGTAYSDGQIYDFFSSLTLHAQWQFERPITIRFDANGGQGSQANLNAGGGVPASLPANGLTRSGYAFVGWNSASNGSGIAYADGSMVTFEADQTLYAQWVPLITNLTPSVFAGGISLSWGLNTAGPVADSLALMFQPSNSSPPSWTSLHYSGGERIPGNALTDFVDGLQRGTRYDFKVASFRNGAAVYSSVVSATTADYPGPPGRPTASRTGSYSLNLSWEPGYNGGIPIGSYQLFYRRQGTDLWYAFDPSFRSEPNFSAFGNLQWGQTYELAVRAFNDLGAGPLSPSISYRAYGPPDRVDAIGLRAVGGFRCRVDWAPPSFDGGSAITNYTTYSHRVGDNSQGFQLHSWQPAEARSANLRLWRGAGTRYECGVRAVNAAGESALVSQIIRIY